MTDPTNPPTPAEIAEIAEHARAQNKAGNLCLCHAEKACADSAFEGLPCKSVEALLACAERGIAPPSGEVEWALGYLDSIAIRVHDIENEREKAFDILRRLSAPPVAAPSGEAAPKPHTAKFTGEYYRALADGSKGVDSETFEDALNHAAYLADSVRTLSDGKAAAEAESNANAAGWKDAAERAEVMKQTAEGWKEKSDASESRCAALERALTITRGQWIHSVHAEQCIAALSSAEAAKPIMPECVRELMCEAMVASNSLYAPMETAERILAANKLASAHAAVESYYAKPSATAGEGGE